MEKLKDALAEAEVSNVELERLRAEGGALQLKSLTSDLDLAHERFGRQMLVEKVDDLERIVENYAEVAQIRVSRRSWKSLRIRYLWSCAGLKSALGVGETRFPGMVSKLHGQTGRVSRTGLRSLRSSETVIRSPTPSTWHKKSGHRTASISDSFHAV